MSEPIRILYVDDYPLDRELVRDALEKEQGGFRVTEASSRTDFEARLAEGDYDLVLSDFKIPGFEGLQLLDAVHAKNPRVPVIIVTGTGSEEVAVEAMKRGAADYVIKTTKHIQRLPLTIHAALQKKWMEEERERAEAVLRESESKYRTLLKNIPQKIFTKDRNSVYVSCNENFARDLEIRPDQCAGKTDYDFFPRELADKYGADDKRIMEAGQTEALDEKYLQDGQDVWVQTIKTPIRQEDGRVIGILGIFWDITERKRAEEALRQSQERYRALADNSLLGIAVMDTDYRIITVNATFAGLFRKPAGDFVGKYCFNEFEKRPAVCSHCPGTRAMASGSTAEVETQGVRDDGSRFYVRNRAVPFFGPEGEVSGFIEIVEDIDKRKRAEEALLESEEKYRLLAEATPDVIWQLGLDLRVIYVNSAIQKVLGYAAEEFVGRALEDFCSAERLRQMKEIITREMQSLERHAGVVFETEMIHKSGRTVPLEIHGMIQKDTSGKPTGFQGVSRDITERKRAEEELRFRNLILSTQQEAAIDGILVVDEDAMIVSCNRRFVEMWGIPPEFVEKKVDEPVLHHVTAQIVDPRSFLQRVQYLYEHRQETSRDELILADGRIFDRYSAPMFGSDGRYYGRVWYFRDITERKKAEEEREKLQAQLNQAQKMESVGRLAGGVAHDFNNMLSVILGHAEMALYKVNPAHPLYANLKEILNAAIHSAEIVRQLLAFARKQTIAPKVLDLNETVEDMLKILRRLIGEDIDLVWLPESGLGQLKMDPTQIEQILVNLCVNARDAIAGVGKVTIETGNAAFDETYCADHAGFVPGEYVMLAISDDGCGMDEENLDKIFEPFFTTKGVGHGTGLGLATVYGIVKQNNGFINVYSERGKGTTFKIYLPRQAEQAVDTRKENEGELPLNRSETVLVVEDEVSVLKLVVSMLDGLGYTVLSVGTPGEAMRLVEEYTGEIHLLITDVILPKMNGKELAEQIRKTCPAMKCLFMSGYTANVIARHGMLDEGINFIQKPFSMQALAAKVRDALDSK